MNDKVENGENLREAARSECILSIKLLADGLDHMEDIMRVAKMKHAPSYTKQLLSAEWEAVFKARRGMEEHEIKYNSMPDADEVTQMLVEITEKHYDKIKEQYEGYIKHNNSLR